MSKIKESRFSRYRVDVETLYNICFAILCQISSEGFSYQQVEYIIRTKNSSMTIVDLVFENVPIRYLITYSLQLNKKIDNIWRQLNYLLFHRSYEIKCYDEDDPCIEFVNNYFQNAIKKRWLYSSCSPFVKTKGLDLLDLTFLRIYEILSNESFECFYQFQSNLLSSLSLTTFPIHWLSRLNHLCLSENLISHYPTDPLLHQTINNYLIPNAHDVIIAGLNVTFAHDSEKMNIMNDILWKSFMKNNVIRLQLYRCDLNIIYNLIRLFHVDYCLYPNDNRRFEQTKIQTLPQENVEKPAFVQASHSLIYTKKESTINDNQQQRINLSKTAFSNIVSNRSAIVVRNEPEPAHILNSSLVNICNNDTEVYLYKHGSSLAHGIEEIVIDTSHISDLQKQKEFSRTYNDLFRFLYNLKKITLKNCFIDHQSTVQHLPFKSLVHLFSYIGFQIYRSMAESFQLKSLSIENCTIQPQQSRVILNTNEISRSPKSYLIHSKLPKQQIPHENHRLVFTSLTAFEDILWYLTILRLRNVKIHERVQKGKSLSSIVKNPIESFFPKQKLMVFSINPSTNINYNNTKLTYYLTTDPPGPLSFCFQAPFVSIFGPNPLNLPRQQKEMTEDFEVTDNTKQNQGLFSTPVLPQAISEVKRQILNSKELLTTKKTFVSNKQTPSSLAKANQTRRKTIPPPVIHHDDTLSATLTLDDSVLSSTKTSIVSSILSLEPIVHQAIYSFLRVLDLSGTQLETADYIHLVYIVEHAPFLEAFDFSRWSKTVDFVPIFNGITTHCSNFKWLNLEQTHLTQSSIISLISLFKSHSKTMIYINLKQTNLSLSPNHLLIEFIHSLHQCILLEYINLAKNFLSDQFLFTFLTEEYCQKVQHLRFIDIRHNTLITLDTIFQIIYRFYQHPIPTLLFCGLITTSNTNKEQRQVIMRYGGTIMARSMPYQYD